jgi:hypothetical protein
VTLRPAILLTTLAGLASPVAGQQPPYAEPPSKTDPLPRPEPKPIRPLPGPGTPITPLPADSSIPGLEDADYRVHPPPLRSEGTFLIHKRGSMLRLPTGERAFIFETDDKDKTERPMVLIPNQVLQRMEQSAAERSEPSVFYITGQVFSFKNVNYLLPSASSSLQPIADAESKPPSPEAAGPTVGPPRPGDDSAPLVQELIKNLEAQHERPRAIEPEAPPPAPTGADHESTPTLAPAIIADTGPGHLIPEGRSILRRRARMVRISSGQWAAAFDAGPKGDPDLDQPMPLVPCLNLQRMESYANSKGDNVTLELSGQVLTYQGHNSLIPTSYRVYPSDDLAPRH